MGWRPGSQLHQHQYAGWRHAVLRGHVNKERHADAKTFPKMHSPSLRRGVAVRPFIRLFSASDQGHSLQDQADRSSPPALHNAEKHVNGILHDRFNGLVLARISANAFRIESSFVLWKAFLCSCAVRICRLELQVYGNRIFLARDDRYLCFNEIAVFSG